MDLFIRGNLKIMKLKEMDIINGVMGDHIVALGKIIKCMDMVFLHGLMEESMKENILKIKNKV